MFLILASRKLQPSKHDYMGTTWDLGGRRWEGGKVGNPMVDHMGPISKLHGETGNRRLGFPYSPHMGPR